jgi:hypothetical protein
MSRHAVRGPSSWLQRRWQSLLRLRRWRLSLVRDGFDMRLVVDSGRSTSRERHRPETVRDTDRAALPPLDPDRLLDARGALRRILDQHPATRAIWPSLAVMDRAMGKHGSAGIDRLSEAVLRDAATVLDRLTDDWCESGVIVLRDRIERVLRSVHGCAPDHEARRQPERVAETQVREASFTEFMEIDREWEETLRIADPPRRRA